jgi:thiamine biosynthesis lipoprotein
MFASLLFALACGRSAPAEADRTEFAFGSYVRIKAIAPSRAIADSALRLAFSEMHRLDSMLSVFYEGSEPGALNESGRARVSPETEEVLREAIGFCSATDGALDITVLPLLKLWGFVDGEQRVPSRTELQAALQLVNWRNVEFRGDTVFLKGGSRVDLGSVAVGYAVDRAAEVLSNAGVSSALVDAGGDIRVMGSRVWRVGLQDPRGDGVLRVFELENAAISTSGDYQKYFEEDGQRYHHILDPATGYPAGQCASVTVVAPSALEADAYSTAIFVLGPAGLARFATDSTTGVVMLVAEGDSLVTLEAGTAR